MSIEKIAQSVCKTNEALCASLTGTLALQGNEKAATSETKVSINDKAKAAFVRICGAKPALCTALFVSLMGHGDGE